MTESQKASVIKDMLRFGRASDLLALMEGESPYTRPSSGGISKANREEGSAFVAALYHVRFVAQFGFEKNCVIEGKHVHSAFPMEFSHWLSLGAPGITNEELSSYLNEHPLSEQEK